MVTALDRDDLIAGLRDLVLRARAEGIRGVSIRIVGGAALRLAYFDRPTTVDIDATSGVGGTDTRHAAERVWERDVRGSV